MEKHKDGAEACFIYVTFDREYLIQGHTCARIRDRKTGMWEPVLPNRLLGVIRRGELDPALVARDAKPRVGDRLCLMIAGLQILSSPVVSVERAAWATVELKQEPDGSLALGALVLQAPGASHRDRKAQLTSGVA